MEKIKAKVRVRKKVWVDDTAEVDGYLYNIQGIFVILHADQYQPDTFSCTEYRTGRYLAKQYPDMQSALNACNERITKVTPAVAQDNVRKVVVKEGAVNG